MDQNPYESPKETPTDDRPSLAPLFRKFCLGGLAVAFLSFAVGLAFTIFERDIGTLAWTWPLDTVLAIGIYGGILSFLIGAGLWAIAR